MDHIPVAVTDLEQSTADFQALGFTLKPGRPHANGLRNAHVKFTDGTEIELITTPAATDALSSEYYSWLRVGDGPAFVGIYAPDFGQLVGRLAQLGLRLERRGGLATLVEPPDLRRLFFADRQRSPTDQRQHFDHSNTAFSLASVWMAADVPEQRLLQSLGAEPIGTPRCGALGPSSIVLSMPEGEVVFLPVGVQAFPERAILGATVMVRSIETARGIFAANHIPYSQPIDCDHLSLWIGPTAAHGMWLEFRQAKF
jgi:hypothetical protein